MPLQIPDPPEIVGNTIRSNVRDLVESGLTSIEDLRQLPANQLEFQRPHQVFTLSRAQLADGAGLDAATPTGWRYLVSAGGQIVASAETGITPSGDHAFAGFLKGPFDAATDAAVGRAADLPQLLEGTFELRLLRIPALYVMALWLHLAPGDIGLGDLGDLLVPLAPTPVGTAEVASPAGELLQQLMQLARDRIDQGE